MRSGGTNNARRRRARAFSQLEDHVERRRRFASRRVAPELERFHNVLLKFGDFRTAQRESDPDRVVLKKFDDPALRRIEDAAAATVKATGLSGVAGAAAASGTYAGMATWGTASTGTAIATLHGAALSNATLAALGGGSLATGGGGIAAGTAVLGGIAAAPVILVGGVVYWHRGRKLLAQAKTNAEELDAAIAKLDADRVRIDRVRALVSRLVDAAEVLLRALKTRLDGVAAWEANDLASCTEQQRRFLARTTAIAETLFVVGSVPAWGRRGGPTRRGSQAVNAVGVVLSDGVLM